MNKPREEDLHAWVDEQLEAPRRAELEGEFARNEEAARRARWYRQINDALKTRQPGLAETRVRRSVFSAFGREADWRYKKGRYNLADETQQFTLVGHADWRHLRLDELNKRLEEFCRRGFEFVDNRSLDRLFLDFVGHDSRAIAGVIEELRRSSQPYIAVSSGLPRATELVGISGGAQSALVTQPALTGQAAIVPIYSPHRMAFVQLACPIIISQLVAYAEWRRAYELAGRKRDIDCRRAKGGRAA